MGLAAAQVISVDARLAVVLLKMGEIFALKQEQKNNTEGFSLWRRFHFILNWLWQEVS